MLGISTPAVSPDSVVVADHYRGPDVAFRPISDLPPFPLLLVSPTGPRRADVAAFIQLSTQVALSWAPSRDEATDG